MSSAPGVTEKLVRRTPLYDVVEREAESFHRKRITESGSVYRERFLEEAAEMPRVRHPNILSVFGLDEAAQTPCQEIERFDGLDLGALARILPPVSPGSRDDEALFALLHELGLGLEAAHAARVTHGFLTPLSVLVDRSGAVKITDFRLGAEPLLPETVGEPSRDLTRLPTVLHAFAPRLEGPTTNRVELDQLLDDLETGRVASATRLVERCQLALAARGPSSCRDRLAKWLGTHLAAAPAAQETLARPPIATGESAPDLESVRSTVRMRPLSGLTLEGRYKILERIGAGGMGTVYRAVQLAVGRDVALKTVLAGVEGEMGPEVFGRFENEARIVSQLRHPNTLRLFDFGRLDGGELYLVTELLHGETLEERLRRGPFEPREALRFLSEIADALQEAHGKGIVHRDIKPRNLFIDRVGDREIIKILDFGLAKLAGLPAHTRVGYILGSPTYMSPEQTAGEEAGPAADLYSLGVTAFEMLAGRPPFVSSDPRSLLLKHRHDPPPRFSELRPPVDVPEELEQVILRMLAKEPADRPSSASALREELLALGANMDRSSSSGGKRASPEGAALIGSKIQSYRIDGVLGEGVASRVYAAEHEVLGRRVAVKVLTSLALRQPSTHQRLRREARVLAQLRHPTIVEVLDFGVQDDGAPYMVLEHIRGKTLKQVLAEEGPVSPERVRSWMIQVSHALVLAHGKGVVHRDLKLSNAMLVTDSAPEQIKVLDFGLARFINAEEAGTKITQHQMLLGTPGYMSPEQIETPSQAGPASDFYALGCMGYALLAGHLPFRGPIADVLEQQRTRMPAPLPPSQGLEQIILRLLQKNPEARPASAAALLESLEALALSLGDEDTFPNEPTNTPVGLFSDAERTEVQQEVAEAPPPAPTLRPTPPREPPRPKALSVPEARAGSPPLVVSVSTPPRNRAMVVLLSLAVLSSFLVAAALVVRLSNRDEVAPVTAPTIAPPPPAPIAVEAPAPSPAPVSPAAIEPASDELVPEPEAATPTSRARRRPKGPSSNKGPLAASTSAPAPSPVLSEELEARLDRALREKGFAPADLSALGALGTELEVTRAALRSGAADAPTRVERAIEEVRAYRPSAGLVKDKLERVARNLGAARNELSTTALDALERRYLDLGQGLSSAVLPSELDRLLREANALERDLAAQRRAGKSR